LLLLLLWCRRRLLCSPSQRQVSHFTCCPGATVYSFIHRHKYMSKYYFVCCDGFDDILLPRTTKQRTITVNNGHEFEERSTARVGAVALIQLFTRMRSVHREGINVLHRMKEKRRRERTLKRRNRKQLNWVTFRTQRERRRPPPDGLTSAMFDLPGEINLKYIQRN